MHGAHFKYWDTPCRAHGGVHVPVAVQFPCQTCVELVTSPATSSPPAGARAREAATERRIIACGELAPSWSRHTPQLGAFERYMECIYKLFLLSIWNTDKMHTKADAKNILFQLKETFRIVSPEEHYHHLSIKIGTIKCSKSRINQIG